MSRSVNSAGVGCIPCERLDRARAEIPVRGGGLSEGMRTLRCVMGLVVVVAVAASARAGFREQNEAEWREALVRAGVEEKAVVVFFRPDPCLIAEVEYDPCKPFDALIAHPAMQRRLRRVVFLTRHVTSDGEVRAPARVAVFDPSGNLAIEWAGVPQSSKVFTRMLNMVALAEAGLVDAHRFAREGRVAAAQRATAVAVLALGDATRGQALLESLRDSTSEEDRQLAAIYLERLNRIVAGRKPSEEVLVRLASDGVTPLVRFEGWMAVGSLRAEDVRYADAATAYGSALDAATLPRDRELALAARQRAEEDSAGVVGIGPRGTAVAGRRTIVPRNIGPKARKVEYRLDGRLVKSESKSPLTTTLNFGPVPTRHVVEITALDGAGKTMDRTSVVVNERSDAFAIEIVSPRSNASVSGSVEVELAARVPQDRRVESVIVEWQGKRISRMTKGPFTTRVEVDGEQGILRAVLRLEDGAEVEDARLLNAGVMTEESGAHLVEVPVYFDGVASTKKDLVVREGETSRVVEQVISAAETPLRIALVFDASSSMEEHMPDVQEAAIRFIEKNLGERDRALVVGFDTTVRMIVRPTSDRALVERGILALRPRGKTALYDALITAMLQFQVSGSRRALVVFSDGMDSSSLFSNSDVAEVARRSGVPIYVLALTPKLLSKPMPRTNREIVLMPDAETKATRARRELMRISRSTGGKAYNMSSLEKLESIWDKIGDDLRKQSLVIYRTVSAGNEWRPLKVTLGGREVRAPSGVYVTSVSD